MSPCGMVGMGIDRLMMTLTSLGIRDLRLVTALGTPNFARRLHVLREGALQLLGMLL